MSHTITFRAQLRPETLKKTLELTCERLELKAPVPVKNYGVGFDRTTGENIQATGLGIQLPGWNSLVVFQEDLQVKCDNYSAYTEDHTDVKSGKEEVGAHGKWGDICHFNRFRDEAMATELMLQAEARGDTFEYHGWNEEEEQVELVLVHQ